MKRTLDRREFTLEAAMAVLSGAVITISGCGGGSPTEANPIPSTAPGDKAATNDDAHTHTVFFN